MISLSQIKFDIPITRKQTEARRCAAKRHTNIIHGFTLIELLVVIAIISLLVSILLPSLNKAKELARSVVCMSNERQLAMAFAQYATDYDGSFPTTGGPSNNSLFWYNTWINLLSEPYMQTGAWDGGIYPLPRADDNAPNAYYGLKQPSVWLCPSATPWANENDKYMCPSYGVNRYLTGWYSAARQMTPYRLDQIKEPGTTPLLFDCDSIFGAYPSHVLEYNGYQRFAHFDKGGDNFLFVDGHVVNIPKLEDNPADLHGTMEDYRYAAEFFVQDINLWY